MMIQPSPRSERLIGSKGRFDDFPTFIEVQARLQPGACAERCEKLASALRVILSVKLVKL